MTKVLFICLHRPDRSPSQRFRFEQYIDILNSNGFQCKHTYLLDEKSDKIFYSEKKFFSKSKILLKSLLSLIKETYWNKYDIIFVQREAFMLGSSFFEKQMSKRAKLIFDFDDAIWKTQTGEIKSKNKKFYFLKNPSKTKELISYADLIFAGNNYLKGYALGYNNNILIVPTTIDTQEYKPFEKRNKKDVVTIGWSGSFSTIIHFEYVIPALVELKKKYQTRINFQIIGDSNFENAELDAKGIAWNKSTELTDLSAIDIGLMPLPDDEWTKGKCGLKGLQYMALGIPTIMSPVGVNTEIISEAENGFFASTKQDWIDKISLLIESEELRKRIGKNGRKTVVENYSVEANKGLYIEAFTSLKNPEF